MRQIKKMRLKISDGGGTQNKRREDIIWIKNLNLGEGEKTSKKQILNYKFKFGGRDTKKGGRGEKTTKINAVMSAVIFVVILYFIPKAGSALSLSSFEVSLSYPTVIGEENTSSSHSELCDGVVYDATRGHSKVALGIFIYLGQDIRKCSYLVGTLECKSSPNRHPLMYLVLLLAHRVQYILLVPPLSVQNGIGNMQRHTC